MTASDKEYIKMTATLTAEATVRQFRTTLNCDKNVSRISTLEQTVNNGIKDRGEENAKSITGLRKFLFWSLMSVVLLVIAGVVTVIFT